MLLTGKTHTMLGVLSDPGIIPRTVKTLFQMISEESMKADTDNLPPPKTTVKFSYLEIYNEKVIFKCFSATCRK